MPASEPPPTPERSLMKVETTDLGDTARVLLWRGTELMVGTVDGRIIRWVSAHPRGPSGSSLSPEAVVSHLGGAAVTALGPLGARTVVGTDAGDVWASSRGHPVRLTALPDPIIGVAALGAEAVVAAGETLVGLRSTGPSHFMRSPVGPIVSMANSASANGTVIIGGIAGLGMIDPHRPEERRWVEAPTITAVAISGDGNSVAAGDLTGSLHIVDPHTGEGVEITGYPDRIANLCWTGTSREVVVAADDELTIWSVDNTGQTSDNPRILVGHDSPITAVAADPTSARLAAGDLTGGLTIWDLGRTENKPVAKFEAGSQVVRLAWAPDGATLAASSAAGHLLRLGPPLSE